MNRMCRAHPAQRRANRGITLFEILVVMGIVGILTAIGVPSFRYITTSNRIASEVNGLLGDLQFARAEAIKEGQTVTVCVSTDNTNCSTTSTAWNSGWIVFSDVNNDATINTNIVLHKQTAFSGTDTFTASNSIGSISFNREGFAERDGFTEEAVLADAQELHSRLLRAAQMIQRAK